MLRTKEQDSLIKDIKRNSDYKASIVDALVNFHADLAHSNHKMCADIYRHGVKGLDKCTPAELVEEIAKFRQDGDTLVDAANRLGGMAPSS